MKRALIWKLNLALLGAALLSGCDQIAERAGFPDPARIEAEGKAIGGACRHAGRGLEDCYHLNETASKPAIYAGWKEMNEYMAKNHMQSVEPTIPQQQLAPPLTKKKSKSATDEDGADSADTGKSKDKTNHATDGETAQER